MKKVLPKFDEPCGYCDRPMRRSLVERAGAPFCEVCEAERVAEFARKYPAKPPTFSVEALLGDTYF